MRDIDSTTGEVISALAHAIADARTTNARSRPALYCPTLMSDHDYARQIIERVTSFFPQHATARVLGAVRKRESFATMQRSSIEAAHALLNRLSLPNTVAPRPPNGARWSEVLWALVDDAEEKGCLATRHKRRPGDRSAGSLPVLVECVLLWRFATGSWPATTRREADAHSRKVGLIATAPLYGAIQDQLRLIGHVVPAGFSPSTFIRAVGLAKRSVATGALFALHVQTPAETCATGILGHLDRMTQS